jgi:hypothetical protein
MVYLSFSTLRNYTFSGSVVFRLRGRRIFFATSFRASGIAVAILERTGSGKDTIFLFNERALSKYGDKRSS